MCLQLQGKQFKAGDMLLMVAAGGMFLYHMFILVASCSMLYSTQRNHTVNFEKKTIPHPLPIVENVGVLYYIGIFSLIDHLVLVFQVIFQTMLLIGGQYASKSTSPIRSIKSEFLWYIAVCNAARWVTDSFFDTTVSQINPIKQIVYPADMWIVISRALFPLMLFYQFHSAHLCYALKHRLYPDRPHAPRPPNVLNA